MRVATLKASACVTRYAATVSGSAGIRPPPIFEMGKIAEVGGASVGGEAFADEVGNGSGRLLSDNCKRPNVGFLDRFGSC